MVPSLSHQIMFRVLLTYTIFALASATGLVLDADLFTGKYFHFAMGSEAPPKVHFALRMTNNHTGFFSLRIDQDVAGIINGHFTNTFQTSWLPFTYETRVDGSNQFLKITPDLGVTAAEEIAAESTTDRVNSYEELVQRIPDLTALVFRYRNGAISTSFLGLPCRLVEYVPGTAIDYDAEDDYEYEESDFSGFGDVF